MKIINKDDKMYNVNRDREGVVSMLRDGLTTEEMIANNAPKLNSLETYIETPVSLTKKASIELRGGRLLSQWRKMRTRCRKEGIYCAEEWCSFDTFEKWSRERHYKNTLFLNRKDKTAGFTPDNCSWQGTPDSIPMSFKGPKASSENHGGTGTRLHNVWRNMRQRCFYNKSTSFPDYGGRGITICDEWASSFSTFRTWALNNGYGDKLTIDRMDVNKDYSPDNCKWIPMSEQSKNKRINANNTIGATGILKSGSKYTIKVNLPNRKVITMSNFNNIQEAASMREYIIYALGLDIRGNNVDITELKEKFGKDGVFEEVRAFIKCIPLRGKDSKSKKTIRGSRYYGVSKDNKGYYKAWVRIDGKTVLIPGGTTNEKDCAAYYNSFILVKDLDKPLNMSAGCILTKELKEITYFSKYSEEEIEMIKNAREEVKVKNKNNTSGLIGVFKAKKEGKFTSEVKGKGFNNDKKLSMGVFNTKYGAALAREVFIIKYNINSKLNEIEEASIVLREVSDLIDVEEVKKKVQVLSNEIGLVKYNPSVFYIGR